MSNLKFPIASLKKTDLRNIDRRDYTNKQPSYKCVHHDRSNAMTNTAKIAKSLSKRHPLLKKFFGFVSLSCENLYVSHIAMLSQGYAMGTLSSTGLKDPFC